MSSQLNVPQLEAVHHVDGPLLVLAGAGSGKTRVITRKIAHLITQGIYQPQHIAAITFTNKASREMQERVGQLLRDQPSRGLTVSTFHSLGVQILRAETKALGLKPRFSILDASDCFALIAEVSKEADKAKLRMLASRISGWKNALVGPEEAARTAADDLERLAARCYADYERTLRAYQAVDFDDLIVLPVRLFEENDEVLDRWRGRLRYLLVDEYQDTNRAQYRLLRQITALRGAFTAVGDDDQAIYAWRGADVANIAQLGKDFPQLKVIKLEQNYRSTGRILGAANTLIANNEKLFEKRLWSKHGPGDSLEVIVAKDADAEAEMVAVKLQTHHFNHRTKYSDYAILYRGNHQARVFEQQLRTHNIPYVISGGSSFFERAEIKDLMAWLRLLANDDDDLAFIRAVTTPKRGVGASTLEALGRYAGLRHASLFAAMFEAGAAHHVPARQLEPLQEFGHFVNRMRWRAERESACVVLEDLLKAIGYEAYLFDTLDTRDAENRWKNVRDFADWICRKGDADEKTLLELTQTITLMNMLDKPDEAPDAVQLATLHAAKGLEFSHVFLVGVEEGILPHRELVDSGKVDEERRLMYVGVTRAQRSLRISYCEKRKRGKEWAPCEPSRFIAELGEDVRRPGDAAASAVSKEDRVQQLGKLKALLAAKTDA